MACSQAKGTKYHQGLSVLKISSIYTRNLHLIPFDPELITHGSKSRIRELFTAFQTIWNHILTREFESQITWVNRRHSSDTSSLHLTRYYHGKPGLTNTLSAQSDTHSVLLHDARKIVFSGRGLDVLSLFLSFGNISYLQQFSTKTSHSILEVCTKQNALPCRQQNWPEGDSFWKQP